MSNSQIDRKKQTYVLPDVDTNYRDMGFNQNKILSDGRMREGGKSRTEQWILICRRDELEPLRSAIVSKPSPPTTLNASRYRIELLLERIDRPKVPL